MLAGDAYRDRVQGLTAQAVSIGITGVPGFLLDRRLLVLGAQPRRCSSERSSSSCYGRSAAGSVTGAWQAKRSQT